MNSKTLLLIFAAFIINATTAFAVSAYPKLIKYTQPDGTKVNIFLKGDEFAKWAETEDGYTLLLTCPF